ncbi:hypothetical protein C8Q77DRAFT_436288 [Trametes polyzona]|nr:hypothetical protein C8Q77DRAFT_436288 [Trametes polyzona]
MRWDIPNASILQEFLLERDADGDNSLQQTHYDPLSFILLGVPLRHRRMLTLDSPAVAVVPPSFSTASHFVDVDTHLTTADSRVFGIPQHALAAYTQPAAADQDEEELDEYLRFSLGIPRDNAPPVEGWWPHAVGPAWFPSVDELDTWTYPPAHLDEDDPFMDPTPDIDALPPELPIDFLSPDFRYIGEVDDLDAYDYYGQPLYVHLAAGFVFDRELFLLDMTLDDFALAMLEQHLEQEAPWELEDEFSNYNFPCLSPQTRILRLPASLSTRSWD